MFLIELIALRSLFSRIVRCLIDLRAVNKFVRIIERYLNELRAVK